MAITYEKNKNLKTYQPKNKEVKMYFYAALFFAPIALYGASFILSKAEELLGVNLYSQTFIYLSFLLSAALIVIFFAVQIFKVKVAGGVRNYFFIKKIKNKIYKNLLDSKLVNVQYYDMDRIELPSIDVDVTVSEININIEVLPGFDDLEQLSNCVTIAFNEGKYRDFVVVESYKKSNGLTYCFTLEDVGKNLSLTPRQVKDLIVDDDDYKFLLQKETIWNVNAAPHMILSGKTGTGKSTLLYSIILQIFYKGLDTYIIDPKNEFKSFSIFFSNIYNTKEEVIELLRKIVGLMEDREKEVNKRAIELNKVSISAYDIGLKPIFIIIDEYSSLVASMDKKERKDFDDLVTILIQRGRSTGTILIAAMQNANADTIKVAIRNQFCCRILLGNSSKEDVQFIFGSGVDNVSSKVEKFTGYYFLTGMVAPKKLFLPNLFKYKLNRLDNFKDVYLQNKNNSR